MLSPGSVHRSLQCCCRSRRQTFPQIILFPTSFCSLYQTPYLCLFMAYVTTHCQVLSCHYFSKKIIRHLPITFPRKYSALHKYVECHEAAKYKEENSFLSLHTEKKRSHQWGTQEKEVIDCSVQCQFMKCVWEHATSIKLVLTQFDC